MAREIFISYSRADKELVHPFAEYISRAVGRACWIDLKGIESGEEFEEVIMEAINECLVVLFMLSDNSLKSPWTKREVYYAEKRKKRIIPIVLDDKGLRGWFDFHFSNLNFINIQSEEQKIKLVGNLRTWLGVEEKDQRKADAEAKRKAEEEARREAEEETKRKAEEEARRNALEVAKQRAEEEVAKQKAADAKLKPIRGRKKLFGIEHGELLYGYGDEFDKVVIPLQWKEADSFREGLARVRDADGKWGFIDKTGKVVIPCQWEYAFSFYEGLAAVEDANGKWGFIDKTGKVVIPCQWREASGFTEGLAPVQDAYKEWGYIDKTGKVVIPCEWNDAGEFNKGVAWVANVKGIMLKIDKTGKVIR